MSNKGKLFHEKPTTMADNYFVTDAVIDWAGNAGIGIIGKNVRNSLPKDTEPFYMHTEKTNATMKNIKAARFFEPILVVKNDLRGFQSVHVSFQSTSSFNIKSVNALNKCTKILNYTRNVEASINNSGRFK